MPKEIVTVTDAVKTTVPIVARPKQVNLYDVKVHVVNKDNYEEFLKEYDGSMNTADEAIVYFSPHAIEHKKLKAITAEQVQEAFGNSKLKVITQPDVLQEHLLSRKGDNTSYLLMSSGNYDGMNLDEFGKKLVG